MGKRLSKIYTRTGDAGETGLGDGSRIRKTHPRVQAMGSADELNSVIGMLVEMLLSEHGTSDAEELAKIASFLRDSQHRIFDLGGEISIPGYSILTNDHVEVIEQRLDELNEHLPPLENFILPGGSILIAQCHLARSVCRRAERDATALAEIETVNPSVLTYLNRMSDYLFVVARSCARLTGIDEVLWKKG